jgi:hypothetical protein
MPKKHLVVLMLGLLAFIHADFALATSQKQQEAAKKWQELPYVGNFSYTPPAQETPAAAGVTFAIVDLYQTEGFAPWLAWPQFADFNAALKRDLTKIFEAKGLSVRGSFDSYELIPFQDKKMSDMYVIPVLELWGTPGKDFEYTVSGKFTIVLKEIITGELMWSKVIPLSGFSAQHLGTFRPKEKGNFDTISDFLNTGNRNDVVKGIEKQYPDFMATMAKLIDAEEMGIIKKQCREIRSKKGY